MVAADGVQRCDWWEQSDPLMRAYHDDEWGIPCHDDHGLFERLMLECFQAGLSWSTILRKRENFARAFDGWNPQRIAEYGPEDAARLLADAGIIRNRLKVAAATTNARAFLAARAEHGTFDRFIWSFVDGAPLVQPTPRTPADVPARTPLSDAISKDLKRRGFTFVGSTIVYAFMQSVGMVNDHLAHCFRAVPTPG
jgi:DNA-3-methyladenine glycosylase I